MEKYEISSLDLRFLVKELKSILIGGFFRKIYQYEEIEGKKKTHQFLFDIFVPGKDRFWLFADKNKIYLTKYKKPSPEKPPAFCQLLRKYLEGSKIIDIKQHEFDRIIEIETEKNTLVIELFSDGNVILCDKEKRIISPLYSQVWKDRKIKPKINYQYPPQKINPFAVNFEYFRDYLLTSKKKIIALLAADFGFGKIYAKEICLRAKIDENTLSDDMSSSLHVKLYNTIQSIDETKLEPTLYENFVSPFPLENNEVGEIKKRMENFYEALDEFFSEQQIKLAEEYEEKRKEEKVKKIERILSEQKDKINELVKKSEENKRKGDLLYSYYNVVEDAIQTINGLKSSGLSWKEIKEAVRELPNTKIVKEIKEREGKVLIELENELIEIDFRKSLSENASMFYEKAKSMKRKIDGIKAAIEKTKMKMKEKSEEKVVTIPIKIEKKEKQWFEKFRWFKTSDGFLVVAGKDATSNEVLIKKYTETNDLVFHSVLHGSPFVVIKSEGREISEIAKKEAAEFAAAYSKAWEMGLGATDVYCVMPEQVSKKAKSGEYLARGAFMIYGEREWYKNTELKIAIGVKLDIDKRIKIISGPPNSVKANSDYFVVVKPGNKKASELARSIKTILIKNAKENDQVIIQQIDLEEIQRLIPYGKGEIFFKDVIFQF
ncbi:MAG: ribosome rescue protein RqcH [Candidatus Aenigmatarchaeota archaeon]